ncbi:putative protein TPRXL [Cervus elaphus]|uniref:putative protein TPRXL n=1 Tax=Cervus elaphus TaxID=9860 RepID=UPI001CC30B87|nr:putative protein TPRXL [Cervus elaphus]XP_043753842.1 putative protein TPRXL [Cervus elaphus]
MALGNHRLLRRLCWAIIKLSSAGSGARHRQEQGCPPRWDSTSPGTLTGRSYTWTSRPARPCSMSMPCRTCQRRCPASAWASTSTAPTTRGCTRMTGSASRRTRGFSTLTRAWTTAPGRSSTSARAASRCLPSTCGSSCHPHPYVRASASGQAVPECTSPSSMPPSQLAAPSSPGSSASLSQACPSASGRTGPLAPSTSSACCPCSSSAPTSVWPTGSWEVRVCLSAAIWTAWR